MATDKVISLPIPDGESEESQKRRVEISNTIQNLAPNVASKIGLTIDSTSTLLLTFLTGFHPAARRSTPVLPEELHLKAIEKLANDLLADVPEAQAIVAADANESRAFRTEIMERNNAFDELKKQGIAQVTWQHLESFEKLGSARIHHYDAWIEYHRTIEEWASLYWPDKVNRQSSDFLIGIKPTPTPKIHQGIRVENFPLRTSQEVDIFFRSASDGHRGTNWRNEELRDRRIYEIPDATHRVEISRYSDETGEALAWESLERLTTAQDSDFSLMALYICGILAPPKALPANRYAGEDIDLNYVMEKIGWLASKPTKAEREELRKKLWTFICYGTRAVVVGERSVPYHDRHTKELIPTRIESAPWQIVATERPKEESVLTEGRPAPLVVSLVLSKEWERLLTHRDLAQYLPMGELLGAIPPNKVAGDWARSIGLCIGRLWRWKSRETAAGQINPTRHELLTHYTPKTKTVEELLKSKDPKRAVEYYRDSLNILLENGLIAPVGDAARDMTAEKMLAPYGRQGWAKAWLDGNSGLMPGEKWQEPLNGRIKARPPIKPKDLKARPTRRRTTPKPTQSP